MEGEQLIQAEAPKIYSARLFRFVLAGLIVVAVGVVALVEAVLALKKWVRVGGLPSHLRVIVFAPLFPFVIYVGLRVLVSAKRRCRSYRVELTTKRITICSLEGERWADWSSLGQFSPDRRKRTVTARITGQSASANLLKAGELSLSSLLLGIDPTVLSEQLNNARENALRPADP